MSKEPSQAYYHRMNRLFACERIEECPDIIEAVGSNIKQFIEFCTHEMECYGWYDVEEMFEEFQRLGCRSFRNRRDYEISLDEWRRLSKAVFERDHYICQYCGKVGGILEVDHIIPYSRGGTYEMNNLATACRTCNRQKRNKTAEEFKQWKESKK